MFDIDVDHQVTTVDRKLGGRTIEAGEARVVTIARSYDTGIDDLWDAVTNAERLPRWFLPVTGELRVGGRYQLEGNAGGEVLRCDPPHAFDLTWEFNGGASWVEVRLTTEGPDRTRFTLNHVSRTGEGDNEFWEQFGPGAVGIGWDLGALGLALHLAAPGGDDIDPARFEAWSTSTDGVRFTTSAAQGWAAAEVAAGESPEVANGRAERTVAFYTTAPPDGEPGEGTAADEKPGETPPPEG